jgi:hypothetical protein
MTIADFIKRSAERSGADTESESFTKFMASLSLESAIPANLMEAFESNLMTEEEAKINPKIKKHFTAGVYDGIDKSLRKLAVKHLGEDELTDLNSEELKTVDIAELLVTKIKAKAAATSAPGDKKALLDEVTRLQNYAEELKTEAAKAVAEVDNKWIRTLTSEKLDAHFMGYDYAMDVPKEISAATAKNLFEAKLKEQGGKYKYVDGKIVLVNAESEELPFSINNKAMDLKGFADSVVEPILKKHNPNTPPAPVPTPTNPNQKPQGNPVARAIALENVKALEGSASVI